MRWKKFIIETTKDKEDLISGALIEVGITNIEIEDKSQITKEEKEAMHIDILPELEDDGKARIFFYEDMDTSPLEESVMLEQVRQAIKELGEFVDLGDVVIKEEITDEKDWINKWKEYFKPFEIDGILIKPSWENVDNINDYQIAVELDPGTAFGTGLHETTRLCIRQLKKYVKEDSVVLDVGCGSGILTIIAKKLGADYCFGIDIDKEAVEASKENALKNGIKDIEWLDGDMITGKTTQQIVGHDKYNIVVANILAEVIIPLQEMIYKHMVYGGIFIMSGIINTKEETVCKAIKDNPHFELVEVTKDGEWVSVTARKVG
ncbi:MAG: 50S ribosomal protein L11 methyltransferase [Lachnospiraceae bacterium]|nr:50S ribosomal protein L11 methyltransferase [Lachnospiraceae bacterium]